MAGYSPAGVAGSIAAGNYNPDWDKQIQDTVQTYPWDAEKAQESLKAAEVQKAQEALMKKEIQLACGLRDDIQREPVSHQDLIDISMKLQQALSLVTQALNRKEGR
jgi:hypothetical protein